MTWACKGFLRIKFLFIRANKIIYLGFLKPILLGKSRKIWKTSLQAAMLAWVMQTLVRIRCLENLRVPLQGSSARFVHGGWVRDLVTTLLQSLALPLASFFVVKVMTSVMASSYSVTGNVYNRQCVQGPRMNSPPYGWPLITSDFSFM